VADVRASTHDPIDPVALVAEIAAPNCGGTVLFLGTVRRSDEDGPVTEIEYSAYEEMLTEEFRRIVGEAAARWPGVRCAAQHRLGAIPLGEPSIAVAAAAPHRAEAFAVARFVIDEAKRRLPVWKKERFVDGSTRWRENEPAGSDARDRSGRPPHQGGGGA
jgi:molybdopterin synthase catalytic subunit